MGYYKVHEIIGNFAIAFDDGQTLYNLIYPQLKKGDTVELDFENVKIFASAFFNYAIGQLLRDIEPDTLNRQLKFINLTAVGENTLRQVIKNAKRYYTEPQHKKAVDEVLEEYVANC